MPSNITSYETGNQHYSQVSKDNAQHISPPEQKEHVLKPNSDGPLHIHYYYQLCMWFYMTDTFFCKASIFYLHASFIYMFYYVFHDCCISHWLLIHMAYD
jgi:hypothetical protein